MTLRLSLRTRLLLSLWIVLILALFLPSLYFTRSLNQDILQETKREAVRRLSIAQWLMTNHGAFQDAERLQEWVLEVGRQLDARVTYVADGGRVIADSDVSFEDIANLENHASRPEIMEARNRDVGMSMRFSGTLRVDLLYAAKTLKPLGGIPPGVLRVALPVSRMSSRLEHLKNIYTGVLTLTLLATTLLVFGLTRQLDRSVRTMMLAAEAIGKGDFKQRILFYPGQEYFPLAFAINQMAERLESHLQTISNQKQQLEAILNGMQEGVMLLDTRGRIHAVNQAFKEMVPGIPQVLGRRPLEVILNTDLQEACDRVIAGKDERRDRAYGLQILLEPERTYDVNIVRVKDEHRRQGAIVVFHDITELKRLEKVRRDFVANVSHELRTPLTSIKGYAETLLSETELDADMIRLSVQVILKNANHMAKMADDLLELTRLESSTQRLNQEPVDAFKAFQAAWNACSGLASAKNIQAAIDLPDGELWVTADFDQLMQVFRNLIENAVKYSPQGQKIVVSGKHREGVATFGVIDEGPGIPKHELKRIFERFYRVEKHRTGDTGSTGLGLAICRHIIRNHGGKIWAESPPPGRDKGSAIYFTLFTASPDQEEDRRQTQ